MGVKWWDTYLIKWKNFLYNLEKAARSSDAGFLVVLYFVSTFNVCLLNVGIWFCSNEFI